MTNKFDQGEPRHEIPDAIVQEQIDWAIGFYTFSEPQLQFLQEELRRGDKAGLALELGEIYRAFKGVPQTTEATIAEAIRQLQKFSQKLELLRK